MQKYRLCDHMLSSKITLVPYKLVYLRTTLYLFQGQPAQKNDYTYAIV